MIKLSIKCRFLLLNVEKNWKHINCFKRVKMRVCKLRWIQILNLKGCETDESFLEESKGKARQSIITFNTQFKIAPFGSHHLRTHHFRSHHFHHPFNPPDAKPRSISTSSLSCQFSLPPCGIFLIRTFLWTLSSPALIDKQRQLLESLPLVLFQEFVGNTNNYLQICHDLKNPIVTRYIRIIPLAWNVYIALRAGFYGCKSGKFRIYLIFLF